MLNTNSQKLTGNTKIGRILNTMVKYSLFGSWYGNYLKTTIGLQNDVALNFVQFFLDHSHHFSPTILLADILDVANTP